MVPRSVLLVVALASAACLTTLNAVRFQPAADAPVVEPRPEGCSVEIVEDGMQPSRAHVVLGLLTLDWSPSQMKDQGAEGALKTMRAAACEHGAHLLIHVRALPKAPDPGFLYEGELAVLLDEEGKPLQPRALGSTSSSGAASTATSDATSPPSSP